MFLCDSDESQVHRFYTKFLEVASFWNFQIWFFLKAQPARKIGHVHNEQLWQGERKNEINCELEFTVCTIIIDGQGRIHLRFATTVRCVSSYLIPCAAVWLAIGWDFVSAGIECMLECLTIVAAWLSLYFPFEGPYKKWPKMAFNHKRSRQRTVTLIGTVACS